MPQRPKRKSGQRQLAIESLEHRQMLSADGLVPFAGDSVLYQIRGTSGNQGQLSEIDVASGAFVDVGSNAGFSINGIGYRTSDNFIYGMEMSNDHLIRIGAGGSYERLGAIDGLPPGSYYTGDFGHDGLLYVRHNNTMFGINVDKVAVERTVNAPGVSGIADIAYNPETELYYAVRRQSGTNKTADFISVDLREGASLGKVTVISSTLAPGGTYGAVFSDANGRIFAANNKGGLYEIDVKTGEAAFAGKTPVASSNDGAAPTNVSVNLPPVVRDSFVSTIQGAENVSLDITQPSDLEGDTLTIRIAELPTLGVVRSAKTPVQVGDLISVERLAALVYDAPVSYDGTADPGDFTYSVTDGEHTVVGRVDFQLSGHSQIAGQVQILDTSDYGAWAGYVFNNEILLSGYDRLGNSVSKVATTDMDGRFLFEGLLPGNYQLDQVQPEDVNDGFAATAELGRVRSSNTIGDIVIPMGESGRYSGFEFVEYAQSSLSGFVFVDANLDGEIHVMEEGVEGVSLRLEGTDELGQRVSQETLSNSFGYYEFGFLRPGEYSIAQSQPDVLASFSEIVGTEGGLASSNRLTGIQLGAGVDGQNYSFGELEKGGVSGSVFLDADIDRVFDEGDTGIEGNQVRLTGVAFDGSLIEQIETTDAYGDYAFDDLLPGTYTIRQVAQPKGLNEGRVNVHSDIQVQSGENVRDLDIDERLDLELARRFESTIELEGTDGDDIIDIVFGESEHSITINGLEQVFAADQVVDFHLDSLDGNDIITMTGTDGVEETRMWSDRTRFHSENWRMTAYSGEVVTVNGGGGYDLAYLYGTKGDENVKSTESYLRMQGDGFMNKAVGFHRGKAYSGGGKNDRAYMYDSKKDDTVKMRADQARMFNRKFDNAVLDFDRVYAYAENGGTDHARLWDSKFGNDRFEAREGFARMYNEGRFYNAATGFEVMVGIADQGGANDRVYLRDTAGDEVLVSTPRESGLKGDGYEIQAEKFERIYAYATGGNDVAYLYDSKLNDRLIATPDNTRLYNSRYYVSVNDFDQVDAYSSNGGSDRAYFHDSVGDDTLIALEREIRMYGEGFDNISHGFSRAYIYGNSGGNDSAFLFDTDRADTVKSSRSNTRIYGPGYYTRVATQFESIEVSFTNISARDRAIVFGVLDSTKVESAGGLSTVMTEFGASFIYEADGLSELSGSDSEDDDGSIFAALFPEDDLFEIPSAT